MLVCRSPYPLVVGALLAMAAAQVASFAAGPEPGGPADLERCRAISDDAARLRCYESATSTPARPPSGAPHLTGGWRLVRSRNPRGGEDAVSVMHTADLFRSDPDFAGLALRCSEAGIEVLVVLLQTLAPRAKPQVVVTGAETPAHFSATVSPPGTALLLPPEATRLANGPWQKLSELTFEIDNEGIAVRGVIPLDGLREALQILAVNCPSR